MPDTEEKPTD
jgi:hypothetical protein